MHTENTCCDLREFGLLKVSGSDALKLLQGQLTLDVTKVSSGEGHLAAICNPQGRVLSLFILFTQHEAFYLLMPKSLLSLTLASLKKYAIFYKVNLSNESDTLDILGFSLHNDITPSIITVATTIAFFSQFFLIGKKEEITLYKTELLKSAQLVDYPTWKYQMLLEGIPLLYPETSGLFLPHELNLPALKAVSFNKGCYTGQEIIARMQYRGKLKTHLYRAELTNEDDILPGTKIYADENKESKECGFIVDTARTIYNETMALIITDEKYVRENSVYLAKDKNFFTFLDSPSEK